MRTFALALGGGGARGLAHIAVLEALDELGAKPVAIAGTSIGALVGAAYAAGMSGRQIRRFVVSLAHDRAEVLRRLFAARVGTFATLLSTGIRGATLVDAEKFCAQFLPHQVPGVFDQLAIPLTAIATDLHRRQQVAFSSGPLAPALAASIALPTLMRPVVLDGRVLIDGGAVKSCNVLAVQCEGAAITTIEGLSAPDGALHPVQEAFRDCHALQCGFCTPGMIMSVVDLCARLPDADEAQVREQLEGNYCRCTGYQNIVRAVEQAQRTMRGRGERR